MPSENRPERPSPSAPREREDRSEHHRDVLPRDDEQMLEAGRLEGPRGDRIELARRHRGRDRAAARLRAAGRSVRSWTRRTRARPGSDRTKGFGAGPRRATSGGAKHDGEPTPTQRVGEVGVVRDLEAPAELRADPQRTAAGRSSSPSTQTRLADRDRATAPGHASDVDERVPADRARHRILPERPDHGDGAGRETTEERGLPAACATPPQPTPQQEDAEDQQRQSGEGAAATVGRRGRDGDHRPRLRARQTRSSERVTAARPGGREPGRGEDRDADDEPGPRGRRLGSPGPPVPRQETGPERPGRERRSPRSHGLTPSPGAAASRASPVRSRTPHPADRRT